MRHSDSVRIAVLAMPRHGANVTALECLRESGFSGKVAAVARYDDEVQWAKDHGVGIAFNVYAGAGLELADQVAGGPAPHSVESDSDPDSDDVETHIDNTDIDNDVPGETQVQPTEGGSPGGS